MNHPITDMIELMFAADAPPAAIIAAVRAMECVTLVTRDVTLLSRVTSREQAKVRQKNFRIRKKEQELAREVKANDVTSRNANVTRDSVTATLSDCLTSSCLLTSFSEEPLKKERKKESSGIQARARGTRMEPGTPLSDEHRALILAEGITDPDKFWAEFVDYWSEVPGQRGVKIGWTGTLRNRCRDVISKGFNRPSQGKNNGRRTVHDAANDLLDRVQAFDEPAPSGIRGGTFQGPLRLIPSR